MIVFSMIVMDKYTQGETIDFKYSFILESLLRASRTLRILVSKSTILVHEYHGILYIYIYLSLVMKPIKISNNLVIGDSN